MSRTLSRRIGRNGVPLIVISTILLIGYIHHGMKFGADTWRDPGFFIASFIIELIPLYFIYYVYSYKICTDKTGISVSPLAERGPLTKMRFDEIETVDLQPLSALGSIPNARSNPSVIVLYRKGWDGYELFALDPSRTNLLQFKDLVRLLHERQPAAFTENALRYLNSPKLMTPCENRQGELVW